MNKKQITLLGVLAGIAITALAAYVVSSSGSKSKFKSFEKKGKRLVKDLAENLATIREKLEECKSEELKEEPKSAAV